MAPPKMKWLEDDKPRSLAPHFIKIGRIFYFGEVVLGTSIPHGFGIYIREDGKCLCECYLKDGLEEGTSLAIMLNRRGYINMIDCEAS